MKKYQKYTFMCVFSLSIILVTTVYAQENQTYQREETIPQELPRQETSTQKLSQPKESLSQETDRQGVSVPKETISEGIIPSLKFKEAEIKVVLQAIAQKATKDGKAVNIIVAPEVEGLVTVDLKNVHWQTALDAVLKMYGYSYEWIGEIIMITTPEKLAEKRQKETQAAEQEPLETTTYVLKFLDANDVKTLITPLITARGRILVLETATQKGWIARGGFGGGETQEGEFGRAKRETGAKPRTKTLVITDTKSNLATILKTIGNVDVMPNQVLIEAKIMEVNRDTLRDIGFDYGTGSTGATGDYSFINMEANDKKGATGGFMKSGAVEPSVFGPKTDDIEGTLNNYNTGLEFLLRKYTGTQFEAVLHALEEDVHTNILSAPRIVTIDGQEAYIMVGDKQPIIKSEITDSETDVAISKNLSYYQNLGIELNVVPQICDDEYVNMIIYPSVTSSSQSVTATSQLGAASSEDDYPIINVRETQTQVLMQDGETIAIGGLLKDVKSEGVIKVPILGDIPLIGLLFQRKTTDTEKIDLVIFITVKILRPGKDIPQTYLDTGGVASKFKEKTHSKRPKTSRLEE